MGLLDISNKITAELESGLSREDIFNKQVRATPAEAAKYAYCIASIPTPALRKQYLTLNALLSLLLIVYAALTVFAELPINLDEPTIFILIRTLLPLIFLYFTFRFHGGVYRLIGLWFLFDLLESILLTGVPTLVAALKLLVLFLIVVLSFLIARKVFHNLKVLGPKKDPDGNYLL
ncbi:hypothetical protein JYT85_00770 [Desulfocapsa sp. AH-315-G09]|nr:hypothetical protein [Desulfocapsa sp.]MBN4065165.1 hypothetical protein [Desulfocapsa sp. AH-315-G09]